ncbi:MAG: 3-dehydroquinate synthase [Anaerolineaceae bacterium]|nr:3-dehydroquinate synthase [Anaerolineaceae bacterium]
MAAIRVTAPGGDYDILIEPGLLRRAASWGLRGRVVVITNTTIAPLYGESLARQLDAAVLTMPDGEQYKTLETVAELYAGCVSAGLDRGGTVVALGGGVVGDTAGFVAATYMRGVRLVQVPTSLLAMVDSSVGGKVGVDLPQGKNLVGAFKQPDKVLVDPETLTTLPEREWRCGLAEVIKHGLLADPELLEMASCSQNNTQQAAELVCRAVQVKVDVVQQDPFEQSIRAHLNLGHTFAHAVEQVSSYRWPHGEAVGVGLLAAGRLSHKLGLCGTDLTEQIETILQIVQLPQRLGNLDPELLYEAMHTDKKWQNGNSRFVLLRGVGRAEIVKDVAPEVIIATLKELQ